MILSIAWKNIWRNKLRSTVVIAAMCFGLFSGIFAVALMNGFLLARVDTAIKNEVSSIQLHQTKFLDNSELQHTLKNTDQLISEISRHPDVQAVSKRLKIEAMVSTARAATGASIIGVVPEEEMKLSGIHECVLDSMGAYFEGVSRNPILVSQKLAERLKVKLRSNITIQTVNVHGDMEGRNFKVVGIFKTGNAMFDEMNMFVRFSDMQNMLGIEDDEAHEIAILTKEIMESESLKNHLLSEYATYKMDDYTMQKLENDSIAPEIAQVLKAAQSDKIYSNAELRTFLKEKLGEELYLQNEGQLLELCESGINVMEWMKLAPDLEMSITWLDYMMVIFVGIILFALGFGIVNTMLMAVLERVKELGMLMAIGMNNLKVFAMIMIETVFLAIVGGVFGIALSLLALWPAMSYGLNFSAIQEGFEAMGYASHVFPKISISDYIQVVIMVLVTGVVASIYPALKAVRLKPAEAVRSE